jgi:undecaprenyl-diphosphatase
MRFNLEKIESPIWWGLGTNLFILAFFLYLTELVFAQVLDKFDQVIGHYVRSIRTSKLTTFFEWVTELGSGLVETLIFILISSILFWGFQKREAVLVLAFNLGGAWLLNYLLKEIYQRERPPFPHLGEVHSYSYPSGHAMVSMAFYGLIGYLLWCHWRKKRIITRYFVVVLIALLVFLIGLSRIYLGVHYASDVLAGFLAGSIWLIVSVLLYWIIAKQK